MIADSIDHGTPWLYIQRCNIIYHKLVMNNVIIANPIIVFPPGHHSITEQRFKIKFNCLFFVKGHSFGNMAHAHLCVVNKENKVKCHISVDRHTTN